MSPIMLASQIPTRPVVTLDGEAIAQVKDVVIDGSTRSIAGFTLSGRGLLAGPLPQCLLWPDVHALGPDAVMVADTDVLTDETVLAHPAEARREVVPGAHVVSDAGVDWGEVRDLVIGRHGEVVGFKVTATAALGHEQSTLFIPTHPEHPISGDTVVVPEAAARFAVADLQQFAASAADFHAGRPAVPAARIPTGLTADPEHTHETKGRTAR
ncbi:PRC-barrel domain-containing protein [Streptomyces boninensis]|uniref:PRC-barrel domain-containing protein n=1 Tax=Streptomyces boninensis TaxID=2039455 RepID=UPI003B211E65